MKRTLVRAKALHDDGRIHGRVRLTHESPRANPSGKLRVLVSTVEPSPEDTDELLACHVLVAIFHWGEREFPSVTHGLRALPNQVHVDGRIVRLHVLVEIVL